MPSDTKSTRKTEAPYQPLHDEPEAELPARLRAVIGRLSRRLRHTAASSGLTPSEISALLTIARRGPLRLSELAEIEAINPTMLSRIAGRLSELGLIRRSPDPEDRRAALVDATATGKRVRKRIHRERTEVLQAHLERFNESDRTTLQAALPLLEELAESIGEPQPVRAPQQAPKMRARQAAQAPRRQAGQAGQAPKMQTRQALQAPRGRAAREAKPAGQAR